MTPSHPSDTELPRGSLSGFHRYLRNDIVSGFLVFLIALPLCLGISLASGFPPQAGIFTAIVGALLTPFLSNSELTIKGPAAGLIVIVLGCIQAFGGDGDSIFSEADLAAYRATLAVGLAAACLQFAFGLFRGGIIGDFFPSAAVHGMLAAIGVIIMLKQFPVALGVSAKGEPLELLQEIPHFIVEANPAIAGIGLTSLAIMFLWPLIGIKLPWLKPVPSPLIVLAVSIPMGIWLQLLHQHSYYLANHEYQLGDQYLVPISGELFGLFHQFQTPDFRALGQPKAWWWVFLFFIIGSLESLLSAKAVDLLDPYRRKSNLDRDLMAVGVANAAAAAIGGLPMISEIVRSRANVDNGAKTRFSNLWHGVFLLVCCSLIPMFLHLIPLSALAAMLVYTGYRLAHPREFINVYRIGREQLMIFVITLVAVLATDLLVGILIGIGVKIALHIANGVPLKSIFKPYLEIEQQGEDGCVIHAHQSAIFSNWIPFRRQIEDLGLVQRQNVTIDLSNTKIVDSSVMEKLHEMQETFSSEGLELKISGLESHSAFASHAMSTRKGGLLRMRRLTVLASIDLGERIESICNPFEVVSFSSQECKGRSTFSSMHDSKLPAAPSSKYLRIEVVASSSVCELIVAQMRIELKPTDAVTVYTESIDMMRRPVGPATSNGQTGDLH
ncbi:SulP family inorganic anion transporter [Pirellulaceae bacterium SH501]